MIDITHIRPLFLYLIGLLLMSCGGKGGTEEALLEELDRCIEERAAYYAPREHQVDSLQALLAEPCSANERFELYGRLVETYRSYNLDSQLYYTEQRMLLAQTPLRNRSRYSIMRR